MNADERIAEMQTSSGYSEFEECSVDTLVDYKNELEVHVLGDDDLNLLIEALDSHVYWQLSDEQYRDNGYVMEEGETPEIKECYALMERLRALGGKGPDG